MAESITLVEAKLLLTQAQREYIAVKTAWDEANRVSEAHAKEEHRLQNQAREAHALVLNTEFITLTLGELTPQQYKVKAQEVQQQASEALRTHQATCPPYRAVRVNDAQSKYEALAWLVRTLEKL